MSVDQLPPRRAALPPGDAKLVRYEDYIDNKIRSTRRTVKAVDFGAALVLLAIGLLGFLLCVALVEHWLIPGGFNVTMRTLLFVSLISWISYFAYRRLRPLCLRSINPVYAAHAIEQGSPTLKNSLINLLLFRQRRGEISEAVYHTLEEQAAQRLTRVPTDAAVDRTHLIHCGYVLLAVLAAAALYKVFSPKDPFVAAERVLFPWAEIVPASRVQISGVEPGATTLARGEFLDVSAEVRGIDENDPVLLRFTTTDGRAINKPIAMIPAESGLRFTGRLPDSAAASGAAGVAQNLTYRIEAGDARSLDYPVKVVAAPTILVERVDYDYPAYTCYVDRKVDGLGDIRAIEGTRVTVHARANGPIGKADVDFNADGGRDLSMTSEGDRAQASFGLALREDRKTPEYLSYVLRFTNADRRPNRDPVKHPIEVVPDYLPEVSILSPPEKMLDLHLNNTVVIEVEARDPDFALTKVQLHGEATGRSAIASPLLEKEHIGKFTGKFRFTPSAHNLRAGDIVHYWATADDIRAPKPNTAATERRVFRILSPDPQQQAPPDRLAQRDKRREPGERKGQQGESKQQGDQGESGAAGEQGGRSGDQKPGDAAQGQGHDPQQQGDQKQGQQGEAGQAGGEPQQRGKTDDGQRGSPDSGSNGEQSGDGQTHGDENQAQPKEQQKGSGRSQGQPGNNGSRQGQQSQDGEQIAREQNQTGSEQTGAGAAGGESDAQGSKPAGTRPDDTRGKQSSNPNQRDDSPSESTPVSAEGDDDGTAFERIREHLQRRGELKKDESKSAGAEEQQDPESATGGKKQPSSDHSTDADGSKQQNGSEQLATDDTSQRTASDGKPKPGDQDKKPGGQNEGQSIKPDGARDGETPTQDKGNGTGAETRKDDVLQQDEQPSETGEKTKSPGGQQTSPKGESGAGEQPGENQGVPDSNEKMKPSSKRQQSPSKESNADDQEPPAPGDGKRESDSQGEMGGDRPGGGEEGGGQKANRDGTGSAGQNQSADEGAGVSSEKGPGNNSSNAGQDAEAGRETGASGSEKPGDGSAGREGQGNRPGGAAGRKGSNGDSSDSQKAGEQGDSNSPNNSQSAAQQDRDSNSATEKQPAKQDSLQSGTATGSGGGTNAGLARPSTASGEVPDGDAANLDYARKQTDLVLEKLTDHLKSNRVDEGMLKELGWTEDELRTFVERWQHRKRAASQNDASTDAARQELDDALRSLGLRRAPLRQSRTQDDTQRELREGYRGPVPLEYQERLRAYNQGISRARQDGE